MKRELFVRLATMVLRQTPGQSPEAQAEAIAQQMDFLAAVMGDAPQPAAAPPPPAPKPPAFPIPYPESLAPVEDEPVDLDELRSVGPSNQEEPLIVPATSMAGVDRLRQQPPAPPVRSLRKPPPGRMRVEDLNLLIQERTPETLIVEIPEEGGYAPRKVIFARNVISRHGMDSVQLVYAPINASAQAREAAEVSESIHVDEIPINLPALLKKLQQDAIQSLSKRGPVMSVQPPPTRGPVQPGTTYEDGGSANANQADVNQAGAIFGGLG